MGVSGTGKTTIGKGLSKRLGIPFVEGDDYHPQANVDKMASGKPLNDADRAPWLAALGEVLAKAHESGRGCILACSALKQRYRDTLRQAAQAPVHFVWLHGERELLAKRLSERKGHYFKADLLDSQFEALEAPQQAIELDVVERPEQLIRQAAEKLEALQA